MILHSGWIWHNLDERLIDINTNFKFGLKPREFKLMSFKDASDFAAKEIYNKYKNIFVSYSGGLDSTYVTKTFYELGIPFTAVIVMCEANAEESSYALQYCEKNNIKTKIIKKTNLELLNFYIDEIYNKIKSVGIHSAASVIAGLYSKENNGILIGGDYLLSETGDTIILQDWDLYRDVFIPNINFFMYNESLSYSMIKEAEVPFDSNKYILYGVDKREKIDYNYNTEVRKVFKSINNSVDENFYRVKLMSKLQFLGLMEKYAS